LRDPSRLRRRALFLVSASLLFCSEAQARGHPARRPADPDAAAFRKVCGRCHNVEVPLATVQSAADWRETVQLMVDRGAKGTDADFAGVMRYLRAHRTTINANRASAAELASILGLSDSAAAAIVARRQQRPFKDLADLETVPGLDRSALESRKGRIFF
jgi:hypothetical protein